MGQRGRPGAKKAAAGYQLARKRVEEGQASGEYPPPPPAEGDEDAFDFYLEARMQEVKAVEYGKPKDSREIGEIPMPVCPVLRKWRTADEGQKSA